MCKCNKEASTFCSKIKPSSQKIQNMFWLVTEMKNLDNRTEKKNKNKK